MQIRDFYSLKTFGLTIQRGWVVVLRLACVVRKSAEGEAPAIRGGS